MSSPPNQADCDRIRNNLRLYLEKWWNAKNEADFRLYGRKAEETYLTLAKQCKEGAVETYTKMHAEVKKLPKGPYIRGVEAKMREGKHPQANAGAQQPPV